MYCVLCVCVDMLNVHLMLHFNFRLNSLCQLFNRLYHYLMRSFGIANTPKAMKLTVNQMILICK